jgi:hypothetical protein
MDAAEDLFSADSAAAAIRDRAVLRQATHLSRPDSPHLRDVPGGALVRNGAAVAGRLALTYPPA